MEAAAGAPRLAGSALPAGVTGPQLIRDVLDMAAGSGFTVVRAWCAGRHPSPCSRPAGCAGAPLTRSTATRAQGPRRQHRLRHPDQAWRAERGHAARPRLLSVGGGQARDQGAGARGWGWVPARLPQPLTVRRLPPAPQVILSFTSNWTPSGGIDSFANLTGQRAGCGLPDACLALRAVDAPRRLPSPHWPRPKTQA